MSQIKHFHVQFVSYCNFIPYDRLRIWNSYLIFTTLFSKCVNHYNYFDVIPVSKICCKFCFTKR